MGDICLDDVRGYWRDLAAPAFEEFWLEYQRDCEVTSKHMIVVYRRLITAAFFMNHLADKAALMHGLKKGNQLIDEVKTKDAGTAASLDACRTFVNDAKHEMKRLQEASLRPRVENSDVGGASDVLQFHMLSTDGNDLCDLCKMICAVWRFWISYFDGKGVTTFKDALAYRIGGITSSPGSC